MTNDGASSDWRRTESGVPQNSVLDHSFFLIYINDISDDISSDLFLFADDFLLLDEVVSPTNSADKLNCDLSSVLKCASKWLVPKKKTKSMIFSSKVNKPNHPPGFFSNNLIVYVIFNDHILISMIT